MCGRFNIIDDPLARLLVDIAGGGDFSLETELNVAPTQQVPVFLTDKEGGWQVKPMRWWLVPYWSPEPSNKYTMFNAKSETLTKSRAFKEPFERRRCIMPVSGYYEWRKENGVKVPYYIEPVEAPGFAFASLWDRWRRDDQEIYSCTIITTAAPAGMDEIHHRMPVHLTNEQARQWVQRELPLEDAAQMLVPEIRVSIKMTAMSTYVNNARNKDDRCLEYLGEPRILN